MDASAHYIERIVDLMDSSHNILLNCEQADAIDAVRRGDLAAIRRIQGQFAILASQGRVVRMARSLGRPMRYFLAKRAAGPCLVVAERIDQIREALRDEGLAEQFHPSYTRMVPAHHLLELQLIGCPDPSPTLTRFFAPQKNQLATDLDEIGAAYVSAVAEQCNLWLDRIPRDEPIGVLFSGGIDSGALLIILNHLLLARGCSPARLKAFTLSIDGQGADTAQAADFCHRVGMPMLLEVIERPRESIDWKKAVRAVEDYKPLDIQAAAFGLALCEGIRARYPRWRYLVDGDGGDENLKDYPIEDNPELTIRSVLNNRMLYQEGWGVEAIKHSLVYSGGQSRGHVRSFAPASLHRFEGFSPYAVPDVIEVAEGIPFIELTEWDHKRLYDLKGEIVRRGVKAVTGIDFPVFEKRRFQHGAVAMDTFHALFPKSEREYRRELSDMFN